MHLRTPSCRGARFGTDRSPAAHAPHEFFPHQWAEAVPCSGWSEDEARASAVVEEIRRYGTAHREPDGARMEGHPAVIAGISLLLVPDYYPGEGAGIGHEITRLFGVALVAAPLGPGEWRLVSGDAAAREARA